MNKVSTENKTAQRAVLFTISILFVNGGAKPPPFTNKVSNDQGTPPAGRGSLDDFNFIRIPPAKPPPFINKVSNDQFSRPFVRTSAKSHAHLL